MITKKKQSKLFARNVERKSKQKVGAIGDAAAVELRLKLMAEKAKEQAERKAKREKKRAAFEAKPKNRTRENARRRRQIGSDVLAV